MKIHKWLYGFLCGIGFGIDMKNVDFVAWNWKKVTCKNCLKKKLKKN